MELYIGLMSGTSMDGIDAALLRTDGEDGFEPGACLTFPYDKAFRESLQAHLGKTSGYEALERALTERHAQAVAALLEKAGLTAGDIRAVGFHGHTLFHDAPKGITVQAGDGALLAKLTGIDVVNDLRKADVAAGGQGAPLAPIIHRAILAGRDKPAAALNLGGVGNITWDDGETMIAFDTGPANALIDEFIWARTNAAYDDGGALCAAGTPDPARVGPVLSTPYYAAPAPKSLDRLDLKAPALDDLSIQDGAATLAYLTAESVRIGLERLPSRPREIVVVGGGRHNAGIMRLLRERTGLPVLAAEDLGWNGDAVESMLFAYLAARSLKGLPYTFPGTTGVAQPMTGGVLHKAA